jgi:hypothetical protein
MNDEDARLAGHSSGARRRAYRNILMQTFDVLNLIFRVGRSIYDGDLVGARHPEDAMNPKFAKDVENVIAGPAFRLGG